METVTEQLYTVTTQGFGRIVVEKIEARYPAEALRLARERHGIEQEVHLSTKADTQVQVPTDA